MIAWNPSTLLAVPARTPIRIRAWIVPPNPPTQRDRSVPVVLMSLVACCLFVLVPCMPAFQRMSRTDKLDSLQVMFAMVAIFLCGVQCLI
jgi:hypothetical protein